MNIWEEMEQDAPELLRELGRVVRFRDMPIVAMVDPNPMQEVMAQGGFHVQSSFRVKFFAPAESDLRKRPPENGEQMEVYSMAYTIIAITNRPPSPWIECIVQQTD